MKDFFKTMLACLLAMVFAGGAIVVFSMVMFGVFVAAASSGGEETQTIEKGSVLVFDFSVNVADAPGSRDDQAVLAAIVGEGGPHRVQLRKLVEAIDAAATDDRIKAIYMQGSFVPTNYGSGYGALMEVRAALERFRKSGKEIIAYVVAPSTRDFLMASVATKLWMNPLGIIAAPGLSADVTYYGGLFDKYGIGVQIARTGKYKSYGESYKEDHMSAAEREQLTALLDDVWGEYIATVAQSRKLEPAALQGLIDREGLIAADSARKAGLVDDLADFSKVLSELKAISGVTAPEKTFKQVSMAGYIRSRITGDDKEAAGSKIAIVYAEGMIVDGEGGGDSVGGDRLAREIRKVRHDPEVKAVVLRVNSPGGSAIASEVIRQELELLHAEKPVVVSMGTVAASGGYWISTAGDRIYAEPNTITGSIGVISIVPNIHGLMENFAVHVENVKTARHADIFTLARPRDDEAMALIQSHVDDVYVKFVDHVARSRKMKPEAVEAVAGGRVWSGAEAMNKGLVDEIGGLEAAVEQAASLAQLKKYEVVDRPKGRNFFETVMERLQNGGEEPMSRGPVVELRRQFTHVSDLLKTLNDPAGVYALMPDTVDIR